MNSLLAILSDPSVIGAVAGGGVTGGGLGLYALKQLVTIKKDIAAVKTVLINCKGCKAHFPDDHEP